MADTEEKTKKKTDSRKFIVWLCFTILTFLVVVTCSVVAIFKKELTDVMVDLIKSTIGSYTVVSSIYLGANAGQKIGFAIADAKSEHKEEE